MLFSCASLVSMNAELFALSNSMQHTHSSGTRPYVVRFHRSLHDPFNKTCRQSPCLSRHSKHIQQKRPIEKSCWQQRARAARMKSGRLRLQHHSTTDAIFCTPYDQDKHAYVLALCGDTKQRRKISREFEFRTRSQRRRSAESRQVFHLPIDRRSCSFTDI